jgi:hypothetical protein
MVTAPGKTRTWWHPLLARLMDHLLSGGYSVQEKVLVGLPSLRTEGKATILRPGQRRRPSHRQTESSTADISEDESSPSLLASLACGIVMRFWQSNTPVLRKRGVAATSNREDRMLVVCGTIVTSDRSWSSAAMLRTTAGRVFAARPKSTSQTSPRCTAFAMSALGSVQVEEKLFRRESQIFIGYGRVFHVGHAAQDFRGYLPLIHRG